MTPDDVAAIRANEHPFARSETMILALCDALEAAWAEGNHQSRERQHALDALRIAETRGDNWMRYCGAATERAERAEAERDAYSQKRCTVVDHDITAIEMLRERAERAEAESQRLRGHSVELNALCWAIAELVGDVAEDATEREHDFDNTLRQLDQLSGRNRDALARVRALCAARPLYGTAYSLSERIRAAIEGGQQ